MEAVLQYLREKRRTKEVVMRKVLRGPAGKGVFESAVKSWRCVVGESPIQGKISDSP